MEAQQAAAPGTLSQQPDLSLPGGGYSAPSPIFMGIVRGGGGGICVNPVGGSSCFHYENLMSRTSRTFTARVRSLNFFEAEAITSISPE